MLFILLLTFAFSTISLGLKDESSPLPLCVLDVEMRDGCDGVQKCKCPKDSLCLVTSVEDRLSVCKHPASTTLQPLPSELTTQENIISAFCPYLRTCLSGCVCPNVGYECEDVFGEHLCIRIIPELSTPEPLRTTSGLLVCDLEAIDFDSYDNCDIDCVCPEGFECKRGPFSKRCYPIPEPTTLEPTTRSLPVCSTELFPMQLCGSDCRCPEGTKCERYTPWAPCYPTYDEPTTAVQPLTTESPLPICDHMPSGHLVLCGINCVCQEGSKCSGILSLRGPSCAPDEKQSALDKVDELTDEAIDLAEEQLNKVQQIHNVIEGEEESDNEKKFKAFS